jgi:CRP-like cAMP-binding protein
VARVLCVTHSVTWCPVYKKGDVMILDSPLVVTEESSPVCFLALAQAVSRLDVITRPDRCQEYGVAQGRRLFTCPKGTVTFVLSEAPYTLVDELRVAPMFSHLPREVLEDIASCGEILTFKPPARILQQGQRGTHLYLILEGQVDVLLESESGQTRRIARLGRYDCFGEMSLLAGQPTSATAQAVTEVNVLALPHSRMRELLGTSLPLNQYFVQLLVGRLVRANTAVERTLEHGIAGHLSQMSLGELAQTILAGTRTGILHLRRGSRRAQIFFQNGQIVNAALDGLEGEDAFFELVRWDDGTFRFEQEEFEQERKIRTETMGLLLEAFRRLDEEGGRQRASNVSDGS